LSTPELLQSANAFQAYLEQLQFPTGQRQQNQPQNPVQNAQAPPPPPPTEANNNSGSSSVEDSSITEYADANVSVQIGNQMAEMEKKIEEYVKSQIEQEKKSKEEQNKEKQPTEKALTRHFSQMNLNEEANKDEELMKSTSTAAEEQKATEMVPEPKDDHMEEMPKGDGGRKKTESFTSSDSDVEILNGEEEEENEGGEEEGKDEDLEVEVIIIILYTSTYLHHQGETEYNI
jgi:hypothetical protein